MLRQAVQGGTLVVNGDGSQTRDFIYLDDVVSGMVAAATAPNINGLVINIGSGEEVSILELARLILRITGSSSNLVTSSKVSGGVSRMCANISLAGKRLNYHPSIPLEDGLRLTLQRDARFKNI
jgi:nucleoside-diphosphate-sugar epimerase